MFGSGRVYLYCYIGLTVGNFIASGLLYANVEFTAANNNFLKITPNNCVSISKGRNCFADLEISWELRSPTNVCLYELGVKKPMQCWTKALKGKYSFSFVAKVDTEYLLVDSSIGEVLINEVMFVTWVYQESRKKRRWRVF